MPFLLLEAGIVYSFAIAGSIVDQEEENGGCMSLSISSKGNETANTNSLRPGRSWFPVAKAHHKIRTL